MNLDTIVSVLVAEFRCHTLCERSERIGETAVIFLLFLFIESEGTLFCDVVINLIHVDKARASVEKGAGGVELGFHDRKDFCHSGELDNGLAELLAVFCIRKSLAISSLADADRLGGDAEACAIHKSHHIFDKTKTSAAYEFGGSVFVDKFASGATLDAHLVFDATNCDTAVALVVDEHGKAASIFRALL